SKKLIVTSAETSTSLRLLLLFPLSISTISLRTLSACAAVSELSRDVKASVFSFYTAEFLLVVLVVLLRLFELHLFFHFDWVELAVV
ncbi:hypothetical protein Ancab_023259, partial [Ancistrocladus abbreviatus]